MTTEVSSCPVPPSKQYPPEDEIDEGTYFILSLYPKKMDSFSLNRTKESLICRAYSRNWWHTHMLLLMTKIIQPISNCVCVSFYRYVEWRNQARVKLLDEKQLFKWFSIDLDWVNEEGKRFCRVRFEKSSSEMALRRFCHHRTTWSEFFGDSLCKWNIVRPQCLTARGPPRLLTSLMGLLLICDDVKSGQLSIRLVHSDPSTNSGEAFMSPKKFINNEIQTIITYTMVFVRILQALSGPPVQCSVLRGSWKCMATGLQAN